MKVIGLTGGIGSGKTTVIQYIASKGFPVYIADDAGKRVMETPEVTEKVNILFNGEVLLPNGTLDRKKIGAIVFNNPDLLQQLNAVVHPAVALDFEKFRVANAQAPLLFKESAVLFESGAYRACDATILVTAPEEVRIQRVMSRDHVTKEQVMERIKNQMPDDEKKLLSTYSVENTDLPGTFNKIDEILAQLLNN